MDYPVPQEIATPIFDATPSHSNESDIDKWVNPFALFAREGEDVTQREPMPHVASSSSSQPKDPMNKVAEKMANTMDYPVLKKLADKFKGQLF
ncbi:hypothetical protein OIU78_025909 [Salix suchowensis]|nr:hypothetical protein OIU78_025909 [Salix suchowensis]